MKGSEYFYSLGLAGENVVRTAYQADAYAGHASASGSAERSMKQMLEACDKISLAAAKIRMERGEETKADVFALVLSGQLEGGGQPGQWSIVRDGSTITYEDLSREG